MLELFLTFLKINFLTTSGPASIGLIKQLVVPNMVAEDKFSQMIAIASGIPGSDAVQMAIQVGYHVDGFIGASAALVGALLPCILLVFLTYVGFQFVDQAILAKFFKGINPALAVTLVVTAFGLYTPSSGSIGLIIVAITSILLIVGTPLPILLIISGLLGVWLY